MSTPPETSASSQPQPHVGNPQPGGPQHAIPLTTSVNGTTISIIGKGGAALPTNAPATHFMFTLNDQSGANVKFASLDAADNLTGCPPTGSGNKSTQVVGETMNNNAPQKRAQFTDNNSNPAKNGPMNVSYQWNFTCDAPFTVEPFDPIISNGGKT